MKLYTVGFTKKSAERFFTLLVKSGVTNLIDIRLHPGGQLSGFAKQPDLEYFLSRLSNCSYRHMPELAPAEDVLSDYRKDRDWERYTLRFEALMDERKIPSILDKRHFFEETCCLLCSEATPEKCHRRLVAERLASSWHGLEVVHLV
jgi:uncharacterized protein (DUF488 family)